MSEDVPAEVLAIASRAGFRLDTRYCEDAVMIANVREVQVLPVGLPLSAVQRLALLENLRRVLVKTAAADEARASLETQSRLHRWMHLRAASAEAADAYAGVLRWAGIEVPECLLPPQPPTLE